MSVADQRTQLPAGVLAASAVSAAALAFAVHPLGGEAVIAGFVAAVLVVIAAVDLRTLTIPNRIVLPATAIVLVGDLVVVPGRAPEFLLAALVGGGVLLLPNLISSSLMGMGDVKLGLLLGAALGWGVLGALMIAFLALFPFAVGALIRGGRQAKTAALPFGPFMAFGALVVLVAPRLLGLSG